MFYNIHLLSFDKNFITLHRNIIKSKRGLLYILEKLKINIFERCIDY